MLSLNPSFLGDVFADMKRVANAAGVNGDNVIRSLQDRVQRIEGADHVHKPTVGCIEWLEPLWESGHWVPEMVTPCGRRRILAMAGNTRARSVSWQELEQKDPEILIFMPCGFELLKTS